MGRLLVDPKRCQNRPQILPKSSPNQFKITKYIPGIEGFYEFENVYISNKSQKLVANNQYCELIIKEETGKYFCDMNLNLETNVNEKIFMKLMCEWN